VIDVLGLGSLGQDLRRVDHTAAVGVEGHIIT